MHEDERNASICLALLALARSLGLTVVAEGVENAGQWHWLREHDCDFVQGYGFDRPAPLAQVIERLQTLHRNRAVPFAMGAAGVTGAAAAAPSSSQQARGA